MTGKFIKGTFELEQNVTDLVAFEEPIEPKLTNILNWGNENGVALQFGTSDDNPELLNGGETNGT
jgi:hypothetical protein